MNDHVDHRPSNEISVNYYGTMMETGWKIILIPQNFTKLTFTIFHPIFIMHNSHPNRALQKLYSAKMFKACSPTDMAPDDSIILIFPVYIN